MKKFLLLYIFLLSTVTVTAQTYVEDYLQYVPTAMNFSLRPCGVQSKNNLKDRLFVSLATWSIMAGTSYVLKHTVHEWRPDDSDNLSFPSSHAAKAFCGANIVMHEYKDVSPWIGASAYAVATATATLRVVHDKHYVHDVLAGAAIGILSSEAAYLLLPLWQKLTDRKSADTDENKKENTTTVVVFPSASTEQVGLVGAVVF